MIGFPRKRRRSRLLKEFFRPPQKIAIVGLLLSIIGFGVTQYFDYRNNKELERKRVENLSYTRQLDSLNNVQDSLNNLIQFVELQKIKLKESEDVVNRLQSEQEKLKPVVEADRKTVEALLELQYQRTEHAVWRERSIGFFMGFVASFLASLVIALISYFMKRRVPPTTPTTA